MFTVKRDTIVIIAGLIILVLLFLVGQFKLREYQKYGVFMGTTTSVTIYCKNDKPIKDIEDIIDKLDKEKLSWREPDSVTAKLNDGEKVADHQYTEWIKQCADISKETGGAFDFTLRPLIELWGIETESPRVPMVDDLQYVLKNVGYEAVSIKDDEIDTNTRSIDLGACGKGIALDEIKKYMDEKKIKAGCVSVGGSVLTYGNRPDNKLWTVGINDPKNTGGILYGTLEIEGTKYISTSGDYEKFFEYGGEKYHHIFDRSTGCPADSGLSSVTVICDNGLLSDALSTACFVLGYKKSLKVLKKYNAAAVFITKDNECLKTEDFPYKLISYK